MNLEEIKQACSDKSIIISSSSEEIIVLFVGERKILLKRVSDSHEYLLMLPENDRGYAWKLKPKTKKYWLWKLKGSENSCLTHTHDYYDNEFVDTNGKVYEYLRSAHYKEKILSSEHEE